MILFHFDIIMNMKLKKIFFVSLHSGRQEARWVVQDSAEQNTFFLFLLFILYHTIIYIYTVEFSLKCTIRHRLGNSSTEIWVPPCKC